ncbi:MAG: hypothetical protein L3J78_04325, partial [Thermoplasmata archaeon]|nr:hypothetical protein [Thermoplasmata archaeon]
MSCTEAEMREQSMNVRRGYHRQPHTAEVRFGAQVGCMHLPARIATLGIGILVIATCFLAAGPARAS